MKKIIVLLGIPGSGKGTQAKIIAEKYNYAHISTGNIFRAVLADPTKADPEDIEAINEMKHGKLVADSVVFKLAFAEIERQMKEHAGIVLDGAVRNVNQAKAYEDFFVKNNWGEDVLALEIELTDGEATKRLLLRHEGRSDDTVNVIEKRMKEQGNSQIKPISEFYNNLGILKIVDGDRTVEEVAEEIKKVLEE